MGCKMVFNEADIKSYHIDTTNVINEKIAQMERTKAQYLSMAEALGKQAALEEHRAQYLMKTVYYTDSDGKRQSERVPDTEGRAVAAARAAELRAQEAALRSAANAIGLAMNELRETLAGMERYVGRLLEVVQSTDMSFAQKFEQLRDEIEFFNKNMQSILDSVDEYMNGTADSLKGIGGFESPEKWNFFQSWHGQYVGADGYTGIMITNEFKSQVWDISQRLGMDPNDLMKLMASESKIATHRSPYSGAVGLIQFAVDELFGHTLDDIANMDEFEQLELAEKLLETNMSRYPEANPQNVIDLYTLIFLPDKGGYGQDDSYVLTQDGEKAYRQNQGIDNNTDSSGTRIPDGVIDRGDLRRHLEKQLEVYEKNLRY